MTTQELSYTEHVIDNISNLINVEARTGYTLTSGGTGSRPSWQAYTNGQPTNNIQDSDYVIHSGTREIQDFRAALESLERSIWYGNEDPETGYQSIYPEGFDNRKLKARLTELNEMNFLKNIKFI